MTDAMRREREAADWVARFDRAALPGNDNVVDALSAADPEFAAWVSASLENRTEFLRAFATWRRADRLAALTSATAVEAPARRWRRPVHVITAMAASLALIAMVIGMQLEVTGGPDVFETAIGGHESVALQDGSRVELNTNTRLTARISEETRTVELERGEAYFEIAHDETRPFIVEAGDRRVTVLGTKFTVRREAGEVEVIVTEGKVRIDWLDAESLAAPTVVEKGARVLAREEATLVAAVSAERLNAELGWRQGLLIFDEMDLEAVAAEFNRYNRIQIEVADPDAAAIRIGGSFRAENVDAFARLLKDGFGLKIERRENKIVIKS